MIVTKELLYIVMNNQLAQYKNIDIVHIVNPVCRNHDTCHQCELVSQSSGYCYATLINKTIRKIRFEECYYARH